ncbi:hypothetical protein [Portibacter lacus]|uniref:Uncharacterized protein n=1 Tax=Portibacter lacus TaxID=1099794 RepID=A0AA37WEG1_9BACT|nr:hypothetical protein [Portibacter lacus]GLR17292.1 hypothetical protein GCM10007940_19070 [Portibacter lacus]
MEGDTYFRVFDLVNFGIVNDFDISSIDIGLEISTGINGAQDINLNLYTVSGNLSLANLTPIHNETVAISNQ